MTFYSQPLVKASTLEDTYWDSKNYYQSFTIAEPFKWVVMAGGKYYVPLVVSNTRYAWGWGYNRALGGHTDVYQDPTTAYPGAGTYWGWDGYPSPYDTFFTPGYTLDGVTMSINNGLGWHQADNTPMSIAVGVDDSIHWLQQGGDGYTYVKNTYGHAWVLGQASRASGIGKLDAQMWHAVSSSEIYAFYEKASGAKYPIHVWKWNGASWGSPVQIQNNALATNGVHYKVKALIRAHSSIPQRVLLLISDGTNNLLIWVDLSDNSSSTSAIDTGFPVDEWPVPGKPEVISSTNYIWGFDHAGGLAAQITWTDANWKTPTVAKFTGCGTPSDSYTYDSPDYGEVITTYGFARNRTTNETRGLMLKYGQYNGKYCLRAANIDLMAGTPTWSNYVLIAHQPKERDAANSYSYWEYLAPRHFIYGTDWSNTNKSFIYAVLGERWEDTGKSVNSTTAQKYLIDWWSAGQGFTFTVPVTISPFLLNDVNGIALLIVSPVVETGARVAITPAPAINVTPQVVNGWVWDVAYTLSYTSNLQTAEVLIQPSVVITVNPDDTMKLAAVTITPNPALTVTPSVFQIFTTPLDQCSVYWDLDWVEDVMDLINADRVAGNLAPYKLFTNTLAATQPDIAQLHSEDMATYGVLAVEDAVFPDNRDTLAEQKTLAGIVGRLYEAVTLQPLKLTYTGIGDTDTNSRYAIINQYTVFTAQEMYDWLVAHYNNEIVMYDYGGPTEIYLQIGVAYAPATSYYPTDEFCQWFTITAADYTNYIPGGGGGGGGTFETPFTNEFGLMNTSVYIGTSWHQQFLALVNARREAVGMQPFLDPTPTNYLNHQDIAQHHSEDMATAALFQHESVSFPVGWQSMAQRQTQAQTKTLAENIELKPIAGQKPIFSDSTFPTPQQALDLWWNSPGHRAVLTAYYDGVSMTSFMGIGYGTADPAYYSGYYGWYLTHNLLDLTEYVVDTYLNVNAQFNGALIEWLIETNSLTTYTNVRADHSGKWSIRMEAAHSANYGTRVAQAHKALLQYSLQMDHTAGYVGTVTVRAAHGGEYRLWNKYPVIQDNTAPYSYRVRFGFDAPYEVLGRVRVQEAFYYSSTADVAKAMEADYSIHSPVRASNTSPYIGINNVRQASEFKWDIKSTEIVRTQGKAFWSISEIASLSVSEIATLTVGGRSISIEDGVVSQSEDSMVWEARIRLSDIRDYVLLNVLDPIVFTLGGEPYNLIITGKSIERSGPAKVQVQLSAKSALILKTAPYTTPVESYTIGTPMLASEIVEGMIGTVDWQIVDWLLPVDRVKFENVTPLDAARRLVEVAGGMIHSEKDGTVVVQSLYPVAANRYEEVTPDQVFTDEEDNITVSEEKEVREAYNKFRIREGESAFADRMEWVPDPSGDTSHGTLMVYPSPWRTTFSVYIVDTMTLIQETGVIEREEEQLVQFSAGVGTVNYPCLAINDITWYSDVLGGLAFESGSNTLTAEITVNGGWGLALIKYQTRAYEYDVHGVLGTYALALMEEMGE